MYSDMYSLFCWECLALRMYSSLTVVHVGSGRVSGRLFAACPSGVRSGAPEWRAHTAPAHSCPPALRVPTRHPRPGPRGFKLQLRPKASRQSECPDRDVHTAELEH